MLGMAFVRADTITLYTLFDDTEDWISRLVEATFPCRLSTCWGLDQANFAGELMDSCPALSHFTFSAAAIAAQYD
jgi:hypothetical protein